jgi:hypothetical protein
MYKQLLTSGKAVFVLPAFEFSKNSVQLSASSYPSDKKSLMPYLNRKEIGMFHGKWKRGHGPTNYDLWQTATEPYKITEFNYNYEPYVLMKRDGLPWYSFTQKLNFQVR